MESIEQLRVEIQRSVAAALAEDIGTGDLTARLIPNASEARGRVITREDAVLCGTDWFNAAFETLEGAFQPTSRLFRVEMVGCFLETRHGFRRDPRSRCDDQ